MVLLSSLFIFILQLFAAGILRMLGEYLSSVRNKRIFNVNRTAILLKISFCFNIIETSSDILPYLILVPSNNFSLHCSKVMLQLLFIHIFLQNCALSSTIHFCIVRLLRGVWDYQLVDSTTYTYRIHTLHSIHKNLVQSVPDQQSKNSAMLLYRVWGRHLRKC